MPVKHPERLQLYSLAMPNGVKVSIMLEETGLAARYQTLQWLIFQVAGVGPMFGQVGFFHKFAGREFLWEQHEGPHEDRNA